MFSISKKIKQQALEDLKMAQEEATELYKEALEAGDKERENNVLNLLHSIHEHITYILTSPPYESIH